MEWAAWTLASLSQGDYEMVLFGPVGYEVVLMRGAAGQVCRSSSRP